MDLPTVYLLELVLPPLAGQGDQEKDQPIPGLPDLSVFGIQTHGYRIGFPELEVNRPYRFLSSR
jgi:hypothetical protein